MSLQISQSMAGHGHIWSLTIDYFHLEHIGALFYYPAFSSRAPGGTWHSRQALPLPPLQLRPLSSQRTTVATSQTCTQTSCLHLSLAKALSYTSWQSRSPAKKCQGNLPNKTLTLPKEPTQKMDQKQKGHLHLMYQIHRTKLRHLKEKNRKLQVAVLICQHLVLKYAS